MVRRPRGCQAATISAFRCPIAGHVQRIPSLRPVSRDYCSRGNTVMQKMQRPCWCITFFTFRCVLPTRAPGFCQTRLSPRVNP
ncbi:hypothetical protein ACGYWN_23110 [Burkholderia pseudomallei]|uniref:Uncharacterized protein n=2 Tax=Burkholderia pseudomallei TaxID=28450 RepID=A0AAX0U9E0_BURPE|nr:hypothetical protein [Burkholderia pseudomallei]ABN93414.1 hypothetical protein BURPS1106A_A1293 [Burkholderia pseudomallei 1106a]AUL60333.1 hypothetical protein BHT10_32475 [Burkholderia pseudomallei]EES23309.1 hypothetical protein BURPS1106B_0695 [Burkholderia pseudomallei 1106b]MBF3435091.1 hypothetical protein [Burkholderia pseudomallei]MBF3442621.1 hypothetical protein [Burkholderia pseudomallei]